MAEKNDLQNQVNSLNSQVEILELKTGSTVQGTTEVLSNKKFI